MIHVVLLSGILRYVQKTTTDTAVNRKFGRTLISQILQGFQRPGKTSLNRFMLLIVAPVCFFAQFVAILPAEAYKPGTFPGKGDYQTWRIAGGLSNHGIEFAKAGNYDQAIEKFKAAIAKYQYDGDYFMNLGFAYEKRNHPGDLQKTETAYRQAIRLNPDNWKHWSDLGEVLYSLNRNTESKVALEQAIKCGPPPEVLQNIKENIKQLNSEQHSPSTHRG